MSKFNEPHSKDTVKPGVYTTEFWTSVLTGLFMVGNATDVFNYIPHNIAAGATAFIAAAYGISRGQAKRA